MNKAVSKYKFQFLSDVCISELQQIQLKKRSKAKCNWAISAYNEWCEERLRTFNDNFGIYNPDLYDLPSVKKENLQYALCRFVLEVTKSRGRVSIQARHSTK